MVSDLLRAQLEHMRDDLRAEIAAATAHPESGHGYGTHQADDGTIAFEQAADIAVRRNAERILYEVERALTRMEEGRYGLCRACGKAIDPARLQALPYARYCLDCANRRQGA